MSSPSCCSHCLSITLLHCLSNALPYAFIGFLRHYLFFVFFHHNFHHTWGFISLCYLLFHIFFLYVFCFCRFPCLKSPCPSSFTSEVHFLVIIIINLVCACPLSILIFLFIKGQLFFVYQRLVFFFGYIFGRWKIYPIKASPQVYNVVDFTIDHETQTTQINPSRTWTIDMCFVLACCTCMILKGHH